jgi:hypothetical protein
MADTSRDGNDEAMESRMHESCSSSSGVAGAGQARSIHGRGNDMNSSSSGFNDGACLQRDVNQDVWFMCGSEDELLQHFKDIDALTKKDEHVVYRCYKKLGEFKEVVDRVSNNQATVVFRKLFSYGMGCNREEEIWIEDKLNQQHWSRAYCIVHVHYHGKGVLSYPMPTEVCSVNVRHIDPDHSDPPEDLQGTQSQSQGQGSSSTVTKKPGPKILQWRMENMFHNTAIEEKKLKILPIERWSCANCKNKNSAGTIMCQKCNQGRAECEVFHWNDDQQAANEARKLVQVVLHHTNRITEDKWEVPKWKPGENKFYRSGQLHNVCTLESMSAAQTGKKKTLLNGG